MESEELKKEELKKEELVNKVPEGTEEKVLSKLEESLKKIKIYDEKTNIGLINGIKKYTESIDKLIKTKEDEVTKEKDETKVKELKEELKNLKEIEYELFQKEIEGINKVVKKSTELVDSSFKMGEKFKDGDDYGGTKELGNVISRFGEILGSFDDYDKGITSAVGGLISEFSGMAESFVNGNNEEGVKEIGGTISTIGEMLSKFGGTTGIVGEDMKKFGEGVVKASGNLAKMGESFQGGDIVEGFKGLGSGISSIGEMTAGIDGGITKAIGGGISMITGLWEGISAYFDKDRIAKLEEEKDADIKKMHKAVDEQVNAIHKSIDGLKDLNKTLEKDMGAFKEAFDRGAISAEEYYRLINKTQKEINENKEKEKQLTEEELKKRKLEGFYDKLKNIDFELAKNNGSGGKANDLRTERDKIWKEMEEQGLKDDYNKLKASKDNTNSYGVTDPMSINERALSNNVNSIVIENININGSEKDSKTLAIEIMKEIRALSERKSFDFIMG